MGDIAFVMLDPFLVTAELLLDLMDALIHRHFWTQPGFAGNKVMLVFGRDQDFHFPCMFALVRFHFNRHQAPEVLEQFFGLIVQVTLLIGAQPAVASRYLDLHPGAPWKIVPSSLVIYQPKATFEINPFATFWSSHH
jgi:hypothetical protein